LSVQVHVFYLRGAAERLTLVQTLLHPILTAGTDACIHRPVDHPADLVVVLRRGASAPLTADRLVALLHQARTRPWDGVSYVPAPAWTGGGLLTSGCPSQPPDGVNGWVVTLEEPDASTPQAETAPPDNALLRLLGILTENVAQERISEAAALLCRTDLTVDEKLQALDAIIPIPPTATARQLAAALQVSKPAVVKTTWWRRHRSGDEDWETERRKALHRERAKLIDRPTRDDEDW
jgi:hypothetical protein